MNVDTDQFRALVADVAEIRRQLRGLHFDRTAAFAEGAAFEAERAALKTGPRHARPRRGRPGHLRPVDGGAS